MWFAGFLPSSRCWIIRPIPPERSISFAVLITGILCSSPDGISRTSELAFFLFQSNASLNDNIQGDKEMRRLLIGLLYKQILLNLSTLITSFYLFLLYIVVTPFIMGFEKDFLRHFHLGLIWISLLLSFLSESFFRNDKEDGTLELYSLSTYCLPEILLLQLVGHWVFRISCVFCSLPILQLLYQFDRSGMNWFNILLGSLIFTLMCGIHSCLALGISSSGWNSLQNLTTLPTCLPLIVFCTSIETEWFHVPLLIGYFLLFAFLFPIPVSIGLRDSMANN